MASAAPQYRNERFSKAIQRIPQKTPPIWFMRQAGRYHKHYQALRAKHSFMDLCRVPELAAEVTWGPIQDFDFDVAILFSDLLFPLEGLGMGLSYGDGGPALDWHLESESDLKKLRSASEAMAGVEFQREAMRQTRAKLPADKSLIGFVGGPWTLFTYACQGAHDGSLLRAKKRLPLFARFCETLVPLLVKNIELQLASGAELVMVFDTAAGELSPTLYLEHVVPQLEKLAAAHPGRLGYYSKFTQAAHLAHPLFLNDLFVGLGMDHRWTLNSMLGLKRTGFIQGNFDQALLHAEPVDLRRYMESYAAPLLRLTPEQRAGWVCGLGHGVLPQTPEDNVRAFIAFIRERFA
ncbi:MAG: uroporphyrinogen decarboxylase [Bdellovibrionales bacterium]|nr:uroporphyrinogen decarboxylase [Bdellovibrionales bacterium]